MSKTLSQMLNELKEKIGVGKKDVEARKAALGAIIARGRAAYGLTQCSDYNAFFLPKLAALRAKYGADFMFWAPSMPEKDATHIAMNTAFASGVKYALDMVADIVPEAIAQAEVAGAELKKLEEKKK